LPDFLQDPQKQVAFPRAAQPRLPVITTASKKMQMIAAVVALEAGWHFFTVRAERSLQDEKGNVKFRSGSELGIPTLCKKRQRMGHPDLC